MADEGIGKIGGKDWFKLFRPVSRPTCNIMIILRATKRAVVPTPLRFFRCHTFLLLE